MTDQQKKQKEIACNFAMYFYYQDSPSAGNVYDRWILTEEGKRLTQNEPMNGDAGRAMNGLIKLGDSPSNESLGKWFYKWDRTIIDALKAAAHPVEEPGKRLTAEDETMTAYNLSCQRIDDLTRQLDERDEEIHRLQTTNLILGGLVEKWELLAESREAYEAQVNAKLDLIIGRMKFEKK